MAGHGLFGAGVAAAHDAASCGHTDVRPVKSMSNFVMSALSSGKSAVSRTCRERDASIALSMSGSMLPRQTSYFPARNADPPAVLSGAASAVTRMVLLPTAVSSISPANVSGTRFLLSQDRRHSP